MESVIATPDLSVTIKKKSNKSLPRQKRIREDLASYRSRHPSIDIQQQDAISFLRSLPADSVDLIATDPAYSGMNQHLLLGRGRIVGNYGNREEKWFKEFHDTPENYRELLSEFQRVLKPNSHLFLMFDSFSMLSLGPLVREYFNVKNIITWDKINIGMGHYFRRQTELILFASKGKKPISGRNIPDVWRIKRIHKAAYPTQKPVELFERMIQSSEATPSPDFLVCDPFLGSGSCALAALKCGVSFAGCDIATKSIELTHARIEGYLKTGVDVGQKQTTHTGSGQEKFW